MCESTGMQIIEKMALVAGVQRELAVGDITPSKSMRGGTMPDDADLLDSVKEFGVIESIVVIHCEPITIQCGEIIKTPYLAVAGLRRLCAAVKLGLASVPAVVYSSPEYNAKLAVKDGYHL